MKKDLSSLATEAINPDTKDIDKVSTVEMMKMINNEDKKVAFAVEKEIDQIAKAVDMVAEAFLSGGRLFYIGAGTSGRLGVLDASEILPTFGFPADRVIGLIAGGDTALRLPIEGAEDNEEDGAKDIKEYNFNDGDVLIGLAASGRTPYVIGGLKYANELGAGTISIACAPDSEIGKLADVPIEAVVGPEAIMGSTRMKSGTAQKLVLNMISTGSMVKIGKTYNNLMIDVQATNEKLVNRAINIVSDITDASKDISRKTLEETDYDVKLASFILLTDTDIETANKYIDKADGRVKIALELFEKDK